LAFSVRYEGKFRVAFRIKMLDGGHLSLILMDEPLTMPVQDVGTLCKLLIVLGKHYVEL
jgi:hypothetical protein